MSDISLERKSERRPDRAAFIIAAILIVAAAVVAWDASRLGAGGAYARIGPQSIPYVIAVCLFGLGIWTAIEARRGEFPEREHQEARPVLWIVGGLLVQLLLVKPLPISGIPPYVITGPLSGVLYAFSGFSIATGILFAMVARGFGERRMWLSIPAGIIFAAIVWMIFARGLSLSLPAGPLEQSLGRILNSIISIVRPVPAA